MNKKYGFRNDLEHLSENLGISDERHVEISKACHVAVAECGQEGVPAMLEYTMNRVQPKNEVEAAYVGFVLKGAIDFQSPFVRLEMMLRNASKED